jgi:hypothetical protein
MEQCERKLYRITGGGVREDPLDKSTELGLG